MGRYTTAASRRRQPVAHRSAGLLEINVIERAASQHNVVVSRFHDREVQRLAAQTGPLLLNEVGAGVGEERRVSLGNRVFRLSR